MGVWVCGFSIRALSWGIVRGYKIKWGRFVEIYLSLCVNFQSWVVGQTRSTMMLVYAMIVSIPRRCKYACNGGSILVVQVKNIHCFYITTCTNLLVFVRYYYVCQAALGNYHSPSTSHV